MQHHRDLAVEVRADAISDVRLHQTLEPVTGRGVLVKAVNRSHEGPDRLLGVGAQLHEPLAQPSEMPMFGRGHRGQGGRVVDRGGERGVGCEALEGREFAVRKNGQQVNHSRPIMRVRNGHVGHERQA